MKKYIAVTQDSAKLHSNHSHKESVSELEMKIAITECGRVFYKVAAGAFTAATKWIERPASPYETVAAYLQRVGAVQANFKGQPKVSA